MRLVFSGRALVLGIVLLAAFTLLFPTLQAFLRQRAELDALAAELERSQQRELDLQAELGRWEDPAYIAAQARARLSYVMPGETAYRVVDPEVVDEEVSAAVGPVVADTELPWYLAVWESLETAGAED